MSTRPHGPLSLIAVALVCACGPSGLPGVQVKMNFAGSGAYDAPFPGEHLRQSDGRIDVSRVPNPGEVDLVERVRTLVARDARGFGLSSGLFFALDGPIDPTSLPTVEGSLSASASVALVDIDPDSVERGRHIPIQVAFQPDGGPFGAPNLLAILPLQGTPLRPKTLYAALVTRAVRDPSGAPLGRSGQLAQLLGGTPPAGLESAAFERYRQALTSVDVDEDSLAGLTVFETDDPADRLQRVRTAILAEPLPVPGAFSLVETFDEYCVFQSAVELPVYQAGNPPYTLRGGGIPFDEAGRPVRQRSETARMFVTVPRTAMPAEGYPGAVFIRTGGGGDRPLVDRGPRATEGASSPPGTGPALGLARAGLVGVSIDGPLGGPRNPGGGDEQFAVFNVFNPEALRDNLVQSAAELSLAPRILAALRLDAGACPGATAALRVDARRIALMGHSMGATIAPLVLAYESGFGAAVVSGAGGSWIENLVYKRRPLFVRGVAELVIGYTEIGRRLTPFDPVLTLFQWAGEAADPPLHAGAILKPRPGGAPAHVLMFQGIDDSYIPPEVANPLALSLGLDQALPALEPSLGPLLPIVDRGQRPLPVSGNIGGTTGVVVQLAEDGIEDGHEIMFQRGDARRLYRCFLADFAAGRTPRVVPAAPESEPCP